MVTPRRSGRIAKKIKLQDDIVEQQIKPISRDVSMQDVSDNDFQDPLPMPKPRQTRLTRSRSKVIEEESPLSSVSVEEFSCAATPESSSSSVAVEEPKRITRRNKGKGKAKVVIEQHAFDEEEAMEIDMDDDDEDDDLDFSAAPTLVKAESTMGSLFDDMPSSQVPAPAEELLEDNKEERDPLLDEPTNDDSPAEHDSDESDNGYVSPEEVAPRRRRGRNQQTTFYSNRKATNYKQAQVEILHHHPELETVWSNIEVEMTEKNNVRPIDQPNDLNLPLLPFQRVGVAWMLRQESTDTIKGGILADEMGMGKTIQTIALLLSGRQKPNLVIAPTVAIMQWKKEIETHTNNVLSVHIHHGSNKTEDPKFLKKFDVVLSTYSTLEHAFRRQEYGVKRKDEDGEAYILKSPSPLHRIHWHRVILDEAHNIKDRSSNTARAVFNMNGDFKWSLTGTPLQNRVGELYSLIRFMQADPFSYYYCKECDCKSISWAFSNKKSCDHCNHRPMSHCCWWNNEVLKPIQIHGYIGDGKIAMRKLRLLLDKIMLRRTKVECADDLGLPPRTVICRRDMFGEEEEEVYTSLFKDVKRTFNNYIEEGTVLNNYANIFELLTKMRQCSDHPDLITKKKTDNKQLVCMLCNDPPEDAVSAQCKHVFCRECCIQYYNSFDDSESNVKPKCPSCYANFSVDLTQPTIETEASAGSNSNYAKSSIVNRIDMDKWRSSTKIEALAEELAKLRREDKTIKSIVFSQFVNFLDLIYWRLSRSGYQCIRLDGTMSPIQRQAAIEHFNTNPAITVFLISLKAGGVALNLTQASRVFICDPWWNPATELQAMDRIHRLGQHRPIRITRLIIENSIESRIVQLQDKKTALVESTVEKNSEALDKLTVDDLRFLFVM